MMWLGLVVEWGGRAVDSVVDRVVTTEVVGEVDIVVGKGVEAVDGRGRQGGNVFGQDGDIGKCVKAREIGGRFGQIGVEELGC
jgi:hypothetical protein